MIDQVQHKEIKKVQPCPHSPQYLEIPGHGIGYNALQNKNILQWG